MTMALEAFTSDHLFLASAESYRRGIRAAVYGLWTGALDYEGFWDAMSATIRNGLTRAWERGAAEVGIRMDELSQEEQAALQSAINYEHQWITGYANAIEEKTKALGGKLGPLMSRSAPWIGRYEGVRSKARIMAGQDAKFIWSRGATLKACTSCRRLDNKVKRGSFWQNSGILPRVHGAEYLACKGFGCLCQLLPTDLPVSRGPLPRLP